MNGQNQENWGKIVAIRGSVIDAKFEHELPSIHSLLYAGNNRDIVIEVQMHLDINKICGITLTPTQGLARGDLVEDAHKQLQVPVGPGILSRMFNVFGQTIDNQGVLTDVEWRSIHRPPPVISRRSIESEIFETGTKTSFNEY
jgi:F-type H+-transporting ATPase subunit beta